MSENELKTRVWAAIEAAKPEIRRLAASIHAEPELSGEEFKSMRKIVDYVVSQGFEVEEGVAGLPTAFRARKGGEGAPRLAVLSEYDALPGLGHACGHNLIATCGVATAVGINAVTDELDGRVDLIGTPMEEVHGGKVIMADQGVFADYAAALMAHPDYRSHPYIDSLAMTDYRIEFFGRASHAAANPENGINALDAMILFFNHIGALRQQTRDDARMHGVITDGGKASNIIPDYSAASFMVRARDMAYQRELRERFTACAHAAAQATGCRVEIKELVTYEAFRTNRTIADVYRSELDALGIRYETEMRGSGLGSSDIGNVGSRIPTIHPLYPVTEEVVGLHTERFVEIAGSDEAFERTMECAKALAATALHLLTNPATLQAAQEEHRTAQSAT